MKRNGFLIATVIFLSWWNQYQLIGQTVSTTVSGFLRTGLYQGLSQNSDEGPFASVFGDGGIRVDVRNELNFRAYSDLRYRYGSEFGENVSEVVMREGWISLYSSKIELIMGQRIIKWGRADFDNPTSSLNPRNLIVRSPEKNDIDLGNISATLVWKPASFLSIQGVAAPFYRPDVLITKPINLPETVTINEINGLRGGKSMAGYGIKADFFSRGADFSLSFFNGNDPLPGIAFTSVEADIGEGGVDISSVLTVTPYRVSRAGIDFETVAGRFALRGEGSYTIPELSFSEHEFVPMPEIRWATGADISLGSLMIGAEYIGKYITDFELSPVEPLLPGEIPPLTPEQIGMIPGGLEGYVYLQTAAFNRLYMYQMKEHYHSLGLRIEADMALGRVSPSLIGLYNFTTRELALVPSIKVKPADGLTLMAGADIYKGVKGSLYDIIDRPLSSLFIVLRVDFQ
jgi:hypothetical protein